MDNELAARIVPPDVYVQETGTAKGRGVFAGRAFKQGEVVEYCPVVPFDPLPNRQLPQDLKLIVFGWGKLLKLTRRRPAIVLGYGSLYNHGNPARMRCEADAENRILRLVAIRDIGIGEELTINYNAIESGVSDKDVWFETSGVTLIAD